MVYLQQYKGMRISVAVPVFPVPRSASKITVGLRLTLFGYLIKNDYFACNSISFRAKLA